MQVGGNGKQREGINGMMEKEKAEEDLAADTRRRTQTKTSGPDSRPTRPTIPGRALRAHTSRELMAESSKLGLRVGASKSRS